MPGGVGGEGPRGLPLSRVRARPLKRPPRKGHSADRFASDRWKSKLQMIRKKGVDSGVDDEIETSSGGGLPDLPNAFSLLIDGPECPAFLKTILDVHPDSPSLDQTVRRLLQLVNR